MYGINEQRKSSVNPIKNSAPLEFVKIVDQLVEKRDDGVYIRTSIRRNGRKHKVENID